ncbi:MAG TPA: F0F1 ATP synthase subunit epsilon [Bacteroidetes bacterium]|nr:F0F1 ATP synthase subunit epsilon [Bacteroidota bacterium]
MANKNFQLDIVTPASTVYSGEVQSFTAPGVVGNFQVLFNHAPLLSSVGVGEVKVIESNGAKLLFAISGGFVEVKSNKVILLAESAERSDEINIDRAEKSKKRADERLASKDKSLDPDRARVALYRSINRLKIASKK